MLFGQRIPRHRAKTDAYRAKNIQLMCHKKHEDDLTEAFCPEGLQREIKPGRGMKWVQFLVKFCAKEY